MFIGVQSYAQTGDSLRIYREQLERASLGGNIESFELLGRKLLDYCRKGEDSTALALANESIANTYFTNNLEVLSFGYYEQAADIHKGMGNLSESARIYKQLARMYRNYLVLDKALITGQLCLDLYYEIENKEEVVELLNLLSSINLARMNYDESIVQAKSAVGIAREIGNVRNSAEGYLRLSEIYSTLKSYDSAAVFAETSLKIYSNEQLSFGQIDASRALSEALLGKNELEQALGYIEESLRLAKAAGGMKPVIRAGTIRGKILLKMGDFESAIEQLRTSLDQAERINLSEQTLECNYLLFQVFDKWGQDSVAYSYLKKYSQARDSSYVLELSKELERLQAEYSLGNKQRELEFFKTQSEIKDLRIRQGQVRILIIVTGSFLILLLVLLFYRQKILKQNLVFAEEKLQLERENLHALVDGEQNERARIAQDLHDGLGQLLSTVRMSVSDIEHPKTELNLTILDSAISEVRTISHAMMPTSLRHGLISGLRDMARSINDAGKLSVKTSFPDKKLELSDFAKAGLFRVIQEIVNNSIKYADASEISIRVEMLGNDLRIVLTDDGKGFDVNQINTSASLGWKSLKSRIELLKGDLELSSGQGTKVTLTIPAVE